jgi:large subunit ribosomal protein L18
MRVKPHKNMRLRLAVFRSNKYIYAQVIDDEKGHTVAASFGTDAKKVGADVAKLALKKKVKEVYFDRRKYKYHGKVKELAESARQGGLKF